MFELTKKDKIKIGIVCLIGISSLIAKSFFNYQNYKNIKNINRRMCKNSWEYYE